MTASCAEEKPFSISADIILSISSKAPASIPTSSGVPGMITGYGIHTLTFPSSRALICTELIPFTVTFDTSARYDFPGAAEDTSIFLPFTNRSKPETASSHSR